MEVIKVQPKKEVCYGDIISHINSPYCVTQLNGENNQFITCMCCPIKFIVFLPCHLGFMYNCCINTYCNFSGDEKNYLC